MGGRQEMLEHWQTMRQAEEERRKLIEDREKTLEEERRKMNEDREDLRRKMKQENETALEQQKQTMKDMITAIQAHDNAVKNAEQRLGEERAKWFNRDGILAAERQLKEA